MGDYNAAGADAASQYAEQFRQLINNDPDIQTVVRRVWGNVPVSMRPSDTPKHLEKANDAASKEITQILRAKGIELPDRTFINPRSGALEGHRGWSGLSGPQKALIVGAVAAGTLGTLGATGVIGLPSLGAGGSAATSSGVTGGAVGSGTAAAGTTGTVGIGSRIASILGGVNTGLKTVQGINTALRGGATEQDRGISAGSMADQAARNRLLESQIAQQGPSADAQALKNVQRAGMLANYKPVAASTQALFDKYGKRLPNIDPQTMQFAGGMQAELAKRLAEGKPLTLSGVSGAGAQELADSAAARKYAEHPLGTGVSGAINKGVAIAGLLPDIGNTIGAFKRTAPVDTSRPYQPSVTGQQMAGLLDPQAQQPARDPFARPYDNLFGEGE